MTSDHENALRWAHRANIDRYRRILATPLTETERQFVQNRLAEEQRAMERLGRGQDAVAALAQARLARNR